MNKIVAFLLTILFVLSVMGCATTEDRTQWYYEQSHLYKIPPPGYYTSDP